MGLSVFLLLGGCQIFHDKETGEAIECSDIAGRGHINILTLNLLACEDIPRCDSKKRTERFVKIVDFLVELRNDPKNPTPVDVIFLQEVVGGKLVATTNSARDLRDMLAQQDLSYHLRTAFELGVPELLSVANAILSRCEVEFKRVTHLPKASEIRIGSRVIKFGRNALMVRVNVPDIGDINMYNTHLCSSCTQNERQQQVEQLLEFVNNMETSILGENPVFVGGDLNLDLFRGGKSQTKAGSSFGPEKPLFDLIINDGFIDTYAAFDNRQLHDLCENPYSSDEHCTIGVSAINGSDARRIDYLFARTQGIGEIRESKVIFNPTAQTGKGEGPTVSDHSGVFISVELLKE